MWSRLKTELTADPLGRGYAGMSDQQVVASLAVKDRPLELRSLSGDVVFQQTVPAEFAALTDAKKNLWLAFCGRDSIDPWATANVEFVKWIFGATAATVVNLAAARSALIDRRQELGLPELHAADIARARSLS